VKIGIAYEAKWEPKQMIESGSEFFGELDFLVTFLAMKKVTKCSEQVWYEGIVN